MIMRHSLVIATLVALTGCPQIPSLTVAGDTGSPTGSDAEALDAGALTPTGGPTGYTTLLVNDSFGSEGPTKSPPANITDVSQFNPSTGYGVTGQGWDTWRASFAQSKALSPQTTMASDHLEVAPNEDGNFIVSHFEALPDAHTSYYFEANFAAGCGEYDDAQNLAWPSWGFAPGNDATSTKSIFELDAMKVFATDNDCANGQGLSVDCFVSQAGTGQTFSTTPPGNVDVTATFNVYGLELVYDAAGQISWSLYFNGDLVVTSNEISWSEPPPAMNLGWAGGMTTCAPAVMKIDWVRVWSKST